MALHHIIYHSHHLKPRRKHGAVNSPYGTVPWVLRTDNVLLSGRVWLETWISWLLLSATPISLAPSSNALTTLKHQPQWSPLALHCHFLSPSLRPSSAISQVLVIISKSLTHPPLCSVHWVWTESTDHVFLMQAHNGNTQLKTWTSQHRDIRSFLH